jgi:hypothetical protein
MPDTRIDMLVGLVIGAACIWAFFRMFPGGDE